jgi:glycerol-3-phosphate dehydrogenase
MSFLKKLNKTLGKLFNDEVTAREEGGLLVLSGELPHWNDIVKAGMIAAKEHPYIGLVNDIVCTGETPAPIRKPFVDDGAVEWEEPDVLIIGGGVIGCAIARELSRYKLDVLLVEKEHDLAMQTSGRNDGVVHTGIDLKKGTLKHKYNRLGNRMFGDVCDELGVDFNRCGQYLCFARRIWEPFMFLSLIYWWWQDFKGVKVVNRGDLQRVEPAINPDINSALFFPDTGVVCPFNLTVAYAENAVQNGASIAFDTMVLGMTTEDGVIKSVKTNRGTIHPKVVVNAAGVFCEEIATMAGDRFYSIHPRKGTNLILDKKYTGSLVRTAVSSLSTASTKKKHTKGGAVIRTIGGNILVGPDALETINKEDFSTLPFNITDIIERHKRTIPALAEHQVITYFSGIRAATYEEDFVICKGKFVSNMVHAAGIQSPGLTAAPAIAVDVAQMVVELFGGLRSVEANTEFDPIRPVPPRPSKMDIAARAELIERNPDYGIIVCRCEEVSKGEILNTLRRNVPCDSIDGVKRRARPGMGRCQGGYCEPYVLDIIAKEKSSQLQNVKKSSARTEVLYGCTKTLAEKKKDKEPVKSTRLDRESEAILNERAKQMLAASLFQRKDVNDDG